MEEFMTVLLYVSLSLFAISFFGNIVQWLFFPTWKLKVSRDKFVQEIIYFCKPMLQEKKIKKYPVFKISYYKHKNIAGTYKDDFIRIYIKNNPSVEDLINTVLHEIAHHIQLKSNVKEFQRYVEHNQNVGYWRNPLEKDARKFASKWEDACLEHLVKIGYVKKSV